MNYRLTVVLLAILIVLGATVYLSERGSEQAVTPTPVTGERIFNFESKNLSTLSVNWSGKEVVLRRDANAQWQITRPEQAPADSAAIEDFASQLGRLNSRRDIVVRSAELPNYGLDKPQGAITVTLISGENQRLLVGGASPDGSTYYTRRPVGDEQVVVRVAPAAAVEDLKAIAEEPPKASTPTATPGGPAITTPIPSPAPATSRVPTPTPLLRPPGS